jgi:zinc/manganese transport system substrate-binding protein
MIFAFDRSAKLFIVVLLISLILAIQIKIVEIRSSQGLKVVVTFPFMVRDIESLLCEDDEVRYLVPPGVDPHDYQLTYSDIEVLSKADLIVSTAHTPFEIKIREMALSKEIKATLIEVPSIPNITFLTIPNTNAINYHGVLFYGDNLAIFVKNITSILISLRSGCRDLYLSRLKATMDRIEKMPLKPLKDLKAIVDTPALQYLASWLGAEVIQVVITEHNVPVTPRDINNVEENLRKYRGSIILMMTEDSSARGLLEELAHKYGAKLLVVPNPITSTDSVLDYLENVYNMVRNLRSSSISSTATEHHGLATGSELFIVVILIIIIAIAIAVILRVRR